MQTLQADAPPRTRTLFFVPRWLPPTERWSGMPWRAFPILSSLAARGHRIDFVNEVEDGVDTPANRAALRECEQVVAWCSELNPATQLAGLAAFLRLAREVNPTAPRLAGGGFFTLLPPPRLKPDGYAEEIVPFWEPDLVAGTLERLRSGTAPGAPACEDPAAPPRREKLDSFAVRRLDVRSFRRPEPMIFGNDRLALQIPTGLGCAKRCGFCMWEKTSVRLVPAEDVVDLVVDLRKRADVGQFLFGELDFLTSKKRALATVEGLASRAPGVRWFALTSVGDVAKLSDAELDLFARSGCAALELGTEAGSDDALRRLGKSFGLEEVVDATRRLLARGITPLHNIIFGYVGETAADRRDTVRFVRRLHDLGPGRVRFNFRVYQMIPSTTMGEEALKSMPPIPDTLDGLMGYRLHEGRTMPWLTPEVEREVLFLTEYVLPLAYDDALLEGKPSWSRRALRLVARARARSGFSRFPADRRVFRRVEKVGLKGTYLE